MKTIWIMCRECSQDFGLEVTDDDLFQVVVCPHCEACFDKDEEDLIEGPKYAPPDGLEGKLFLRKPE